MASLLAMFGGGGGGVKSKPAYRIQRTTVEKGNVKSGGYKRNTVQLEPESAGLDLIEEEPNKDKATKACV